MPWDAEVIALRTRRPLAVWRRGTAAAWLLAAGVLIAIPGEALAPGSHLKLVVKPHGRGETALLKSTTLHCAPISGEHPFAPAACAALDAADGNPDKLPKSKSVTCLQIYSPATAMAQGVWEGRQVRWRRVFDNLCQLDAETGAVFRF